MEAQLPLLNPWLVYALIAMLTFSESAAFLGLFVPGEVGLVAVSAITAEAGVHWLGVAGVATSGAALGGLVAYEISSRYGWRVLKWGPMSRLAPGIAALGPRLRSRAGLALVAGSRFNQVLRATVPAAAGMVSMDRRRFAVANAVGALAWAVTFTLVGRFAAEWWRASSGPVHVAAAVVVAVSLITFSILTRRQPGKQR